MKAVADIQYFHHRDSGTLSYVAFDRSTGCAAVIDPVLDFSVVTGRIDTQPCDALIDYINTHDLQVEWILETHAHADHLSGAQHIKREAGGAIAIGAGIKDVQRHFASVFSMPSSFVADGSQFDRLFADGESFSVGNLSVSVVNTPGHTSDSVSYVLGNAIFVGDTLFRPDAGTARCDFPGGDAGTLYDSVQKILAQPDSARLHLCHDYPPEGSEPTVVTTVAEQRQNNIHVASDRSREDFIRTREQRDATLSLPRLIIPAIQVNICAGRLPAAEDNGIAYLKLPLDTF